MSTQTIEDRDTKEPAEETAVVYAVQITIPTTLESLECGVRLANSVDDNGRLNGYWADWWVGNIGDGTVARCGALCGEDTGTPYPNLDVPFATRREAAAEASVQLRLALAERDPNDDSKGQEDVTRFMAAVETGEVPELDEPEGDSLPSGDGPLSELDELILSRQFIAEDYAQAKEVRRLEGIHADLKSETSAAKRSLEKAQDAHTELSLTRMVGLREDYKKGVESRPLLDPAQNPAISENSEPEEPWRVVPITELSLSDGIATKLAENPDRAITTLGELADFEAALGKFEGFENPLCAIPGIGASAAEKISDARVEWFKQHPPEGEGSLEEGE